MSSEIYQQIFLHAQIGIARVSLDGEWLEVNNTLCDILGYSRPDLMACASSRLTHPDDRKNEQPLLDRLLADKKEFQIQKRCLHGDGHNIWIRLSASLVTPQSDEPESFVYLIEDITDLKNTQNALEKTTCRLDSALSGTHTGVWEWDISTNEVFWSDDSERLWGMAKGEFQNSFEHVQATIHPDDVPRWQADLENCLSTGEEHNISFRIFYPDQSIHWIHAKGLVEHDSDGNPSHMRGIVTDVTEREENRRRLAKIENNLNRAQAIAHIGSWEFDVIRDELYWSDEIYRIFGLKPEQFTANLEGFMNAVHPEDRDYVQQEYQASLEGIRPYDIQHRIIRHDTGEIRWVSERCEHVMDNNQVIRSEGMVQDITDRKLADDQIKQLALTDSLTQLPNRHHFLTSFDTHINLANREALSLSLMMLDLDGFKQVNDTHGHPVGDELLRVIADRLNQCLRKTDIIARLGGDEFAILLINPDFPDQVNQMASRIIQSVNRPIALDSIPSQHVGISIGIASFPDDGDDKDELMKNADIALYAAKNQGRNKFCHYIDDELTC